MAQKRKSLSKKVRFEVLKRDSFTCQYCGGSAPDIVLQIDHIHPVAKGGDNDLMNLITSCFDCNSGKRDRKLTDMTAIQKQKKELDELNKRREQLEMMMQWKRELENLKNEELGHVESYLDDRDISLTSYGKQLFRRLIKKHGFKRIYDKLEQAVDNCYKLYYPKSGNVQLTDEVAKLISWEDAVKKDPMKPKKSYIFGVVRNRFHYFNHQMLWGFLNAIVINDSLYEEVLEIAKKAENWSEFKDEILDTYYEQD